MQDNSPHKTTDNDESDDGNSTHDDLEDTPIDEDVQTQNTE